MSHVYNQRHYRSPAVWQDSAEGHVPYNNPVIGGNDVNGEPIYVGRANESGDTIPGKVVPSHRVCYVAYAGRECAHHHYQVLTNPNNTELVWVQASHGSIPTGALAGGKQSDGTNLYIGRGHYNGSMVVGKVHPQHHVLYVSFGGDEHPIHSYEVLVAKNLHTHDY